MTETPGSLSIRASLPVPASAAKGEVLVVEDTPASLVLLCEVLAGAGYSVRQAPSGELALWTVGMRRPELILLDIRLPDVDGFEVCRRLKADPVLSDIPVIFLSALDEIGDKIHGLTLGAVDYITKPYQTREVLARVHTHVTLARLRNALDAERALLEDRVRERTAELEATTAALRASEQDMSHLQDATIVAMASLAETRDNETGNHILRTQNYVRLLASSLSDHPAFRAELTPEKIDLLFKTSPLHDIGKVGIPDHILLKPGRLTPEEFEIIKTHTILGRNAIMAAEKLLDRPNSFLALASEIAYCHHEKWNGSGYPRGLSGNGIPVSARLMAIADVYDAIISRRIYKPAMAHEEAVTIIRDGCGSHFDPEMVKVFLKITEGFQEIALTHACPAAAME